MMMSTIIVEIGWCGFGWLRTGLFPGVALGFVRLSWARGAFVDAVKNAVGRI